LGERLYIAAKAPRAGLVKTRLGHAIGDDAAAYLYRAFVTDLAARFATAPFPVGWYITPPDGWLELGLCPHTWPADQHMLAQGPGDWTERQRALFREAATRGEERVVLVASDSPLLSVEVVEAAFQALEQHDLVFGPVYDGGYYLIGMHGWHDVLDGVTMSTSTVLEAILDRAHAMELSVALIESTFDIDEIDDLKHLQQVSDLPHIAPATDAALHALGLIVPVTHHVEATGYTVHGSDHRYV